MGLTSILKMGRAMMSGKVNADPVRKDDGCPLGARVGAYITIDASVFVTAQALGSLVVPPDPGDVTIRAISRVRFDGGNTSLYRYYLSTGDGGENERYVQIFGGDDGVAEIVYCTSLTRLYPSDPKVLKYYSGELGTEGVGGMLWTFSREDMEQFLSSEQLRILSDARDVVWQRAVGKGDHQSPLHGLEKRIDDSQGINGSCQEIWYVPYTRDVNGYTEHLFISLEVMQSRNGESVRDVHVDFMVGMPLNESMLRII